MSQNNLSGDVAIKGSEGANDRIQTVTEENFQHMVLEAQGPVVVEFMSYGCEHCRQMEPILQKVAELANSGETFFRVNTAVEQTLDEKYEIEGTPTLVMFVNGHEVSRAEGPHPKVATIQALIAQAFS